MQNSFDKSGILEREAHEAAERGNQGEIFHLRQQVMKLCYFREIEEEFRDKLLSILEHGE